MKKFLSFAAFALLMATMTFSLTACSDDDDDAPNSVEQAVLMLKGQWQWPEIHGYDFADEVYDDYASDGRYYLVYKIKADAPDGRWYSDYKGQYVGYVESQTYVFEPSVEDPSKGVIHTYNVNSDWDYSNLTKKSVMQDGEVTTRPKKEIEYVVVARPTLSEK